MSEAMVDFPEKVYDIASAIGWPATIALVKAFGGSEFRIPTFTDRGKRSEIFSVIREAIGQASIEKLCQKYPGELLYIPLCSDVMRELRNKRIRAEHRRLSQTLGGIRLVSLLGRQYNMSNRCVERIVNSTVPQFPPLFDEIEMLVD